MSHFDYNFEALIVEHQFEDKFAYTFSYTIV